MQGRHIPYVSGTATSVLPTAPRSTSHERRIRPGLVRGAGSLIAWIHAIRPRSKSGFCRAPPRCTSAWLFLPPTTVGWSSPTGTSRSQQCARRRYRAARRWRSTPSADDRRPRRLARLSHATLCERAPRRPAQRGQPQPNSHDRRPVQRPQRRISPYPAGHGHRPAAVRRRSIVQARRSGPRPHLRPRWRLDHHHRCRDRHLPPPGNQTRREERRV